MHCQFLCQVLVNFFPPLIDHQHFDPSHGLTRSFVVSNGFFLSVRNLPLFEHLHVAVSELEYDDLCKVKLCWRVLIHLTISAL